MVPSSFITSQMAAAGFSPAMRARSTADSVCPARTSVPPGRASRGRMWPGRTSSSGRALSSSMVRMVRARSAELTPVVMPSRASTVTVKGVPKALRLSSTIGPSSSRAASSGPMARQRKPARAVDQEGDGLRGGVLGRHAEVPLVLAVLIVHHDDEVPLPELLDDGGDVAEDGLFAALFGHDG